MCGIIYFKKLNGAPVSTFVEAAYKYQSGRGQNGFGFTETLDDDFILSRYTTEQEALSWLRKSKASEIMFHHRMPTSSSNNVKSNHPIYSNCDFYKHNYYMIHNGHIRNDDDLKKKHEALGIKYNSTDGDKFTDSEALLHELALIIENIQDPDEFACSGGLAFIMIQTDKNNNPLRLYYGRNSINPLKEYRTVDTIRLTSESMTGEDIDINKLFCYEYVNNMTSFKDVPFEKVKPTLPIPLPDVKTDKKPLVDLIDDLYDDVYLSKKDLSALYKNELETFEKLVRSYILQKMTSLYDDVSENYMTDESIKDKIEGLEKLFNTLKLIFEVK